MASSFGGTIKLQGESEYKKALREITDNLKVLNSEMKVVTSQYDRNDKSASNLSQQNSVLTKKIDEQKEKVNILTKALEDARKETGDNSNTTKKWQVELNNAKAELNKLEKGLDDNEKEMKEFGKATDDAGEKTSRLGDIIKGNLISEGIVSGIKALGSAMKSVGSALIDVGKQAISSYADYEQLVGGVETLFGDSAKVVEDYANKSYQTAGISANQYMEQATSFSASLLQSLGGDTQKVAEVTDMAIIDMSDNANKMGTSLDSIQTAYQGFAKGQYQLLDNLKLGYGGTKGEMERLLADAEKISGVKYDISNLGDVYQAIHVVQTELGITGTTSKEASTTIQGSVSAMKSAWENLLTGVADDNANFGDLINNFVDSIVTVGDNLIPRIEIAIDGIVNLIMGLADKLIERLPELLNVGMEMLQTILNGFMSMLPQLIPVAVQLITSLSTFILQNLPTILQAGITLLLELIKGIAQALPQLIPVAVQCIMDLVNTLLDNIDEVIECGIQLLVALTDGIFNALPELISRLPEIIVKIVAKLIELTPQLLSCVLRLMVSIATGMVRYGVEIVSRIPQIIRSVVNAFLQGVKDFVDIGKNLVKGIWEGLTSSLDWIKNKISGWVGNVFKFIKKLFGISSPSKLFKDEIGTNLALGIGEGFGDTMKDVSQDMANAIPTEFDTNIVATSNNASGNTFNYPNMINGFKEALKGVKVVMNGREMGTFIVDTIESVVYSQ